MTKENLEISNVNKIDESNTDFDRLPMSLRMPFQRLIFEKMGIENDADKIITDGKIVSDYIDHTKNKAVRDLIQAEKFEEAADIVIMEIQREEGLQDAA